jgi:hypothetical protein
LKRQIEAIARNEVLPHGSKLDATEKDKYVAKYNRWYIRAEIARGTLVSRALDKTGRESATGAGFSLAEVIPEELHGLLSRLLVHGRSVHAGRIHAD